MSRFEEMMEFSDRIANKIHEILNSGDKEWTYDEDKEEEV